MIGTYLDSSDDNYLILVREDNFIPCAKPSTGAQVKFLIEHELDRKDRTSYSSKKVSFVL